MTVLEIPVRNDLDKYSLIVTIADTDYRLRLTHNTRDDHWYLAVWLTDGTQLADGIPVVVDTPLLGRWAWNPDLPQDGYLMAVDVTGDGADPVKDDLGDRVKLLWIPFEDLD